MSSKTIVGLVMAAVLVLGVGGFLLLRDGDPAGVTGAAGEQASDGGQAGGEAVVETVAEGFDQPWGLAFLPGEGRLLVTQSQGALSLVDTESGDARDLDGVPDVDSAGQGGLLDVAVHPDFPESDWIYLTYSAADGGGATTTHLARARLDADGGALLDLEELFTAEPFLPETAHYGSRVEFGPDGRVYLTVGDRGDKNFDDHPSQDTSTTLGTTVRLEPDGSVPEDNPYVDDPDFADEIYSYGHRNVQAMAVRPGTEELWQGEHGEEDGDEINIVEAGGNHGWPETHTGCQYGTDIPVGEHPAERDDIVDPVYYWECGTGGFPPSGMVFYEGEQFPEWEGDLLMGTLAGEYLARFTVDGDQVEQADPLLEGEGMRIRDVTVGPHDGAIYVVPDQGDAPLLRIVAGGEED